MAQDRHIKNCAPAGQGCRWAIDNEEERLLNRIENKRMNKCSTCSSVSLRPSASHVALMNKSEWRLLPFAPFVVHRGRVQSPYKPAKQQRRLPMLRNWRPNLQACARNMEVTRGLTRSNKQALISIH